jgi:alpha-galactosidase
MHRRLWSNDPDCVMLRSDATQLDVAAARTWAETVGCSGGLVLVSDDLARLGPDARRLLDEVVERGRAADAAARAGQPPRCDGLLDPDGPLGLAGAGGRVRVDLPTGHGRLV